MDQAKPHNSDDAAEAETVLQRMTRAGQDVRQIYSMPLTKALRLSIAKVADKQMGLPIALIATKVARYEQDRLADLFDGSPLLMLLDGHSGRRGVAVFDANLVGALIQQQTMGKVTPPLDDDPRPMTDTDAAICAPYIDGVLAQAAKMPDDADDRTLLDGYKFGARVADTRLLLMALEQPAYQVIQLTVDVAGGARQGRIILCLPEVGKDMPQFDPEEGEETASPPAPAMLDKTVLELSVELHVALTSVSMPLGVVQNMAVGDVFDLGITAFEEASVQTTHGQRLGAGGLGQINGMRALQLEHSSKQLHHPRRRASDRADLNLPNVKGDGTGTRKEDRANLNLGSDNGDLVEGSLGIEMPPPTAEQFDPAMDLDLPDMSDLPGLGDLSELSEFEEADFGLQTAAG